MVSPLRAEKLKAAKFRQLGWGADDARPSRSGSFDPACRSGSASSSSLRPVMGTGAEDGLLWGSDSWSLCVGDSTDSGVSDILFWDKDRTTSPLQMGHVRRRVVNQGVLPNKLVSSRRPDRVDNTYMHSAWNSCPQGRLITLLCPSIYSSRQTTHST